MDEILIEEKKYISSKRAAKVTGYAKDYIGQLCREGRVPARLVGRSWYVLETAIQDHRFGSQEVAQEKPVEISASRYEASPVEVLPTVNRMRDEEIESSAEENSEGVKISDSWREWFDRVAEAESVVPIVKKTAPMSEIGAPTESVGEEEAVNVPIHSVYIQPPHELLPKHHMEVKPPSEPSYSVRQGTNKMMIRAIQIGGIVLAVITMTLAIASSGYLDKYIISVSPVSIIAGVTLYNK